MGIREKLKALKDNKIAKNTALLSLLYVATFILGFVSQGYYSRIVSDEAYGFVAVALSLRQIFQLFIDFGFLFYAIGEIAKYRDDTAKVREIMTCITIAKLFFSTISVMVMGVIISFSALSGMQVLTYWLYLLSTIIMAMLPDYIYRGFEEMSVITVRTVLIKAFSTVMIFIFLKQENDLYMLPLFEAIGNLVAVIVIYQHLKTKYDVYFVRVKRAEILRTVKESAQFFVSRIATTVYGQANVFIIKWFIDPTDVLSGFYKSANMIVDAAKQGIISPISDSIYPNVMKNKNFGVIKKAIKITLPIIVVGCVGVFFLSDILCSLWLGKERGLEVAKVLRALLPIVVISLPNYILGFPTLNPMGLVKHANMSVNVGTILHIVLMALVIATGNISLMAVCVVTCTTEFAVLLYRMIVVLKNRDLMRTIADESEEEALEKMAEKILEDEEEANERIL